jgi:hypothetical protein
LLGGSLFGGKMRVFFAARALFEASAVEARPSPAAIPAGIAVRKRQ